MLRAVNHILSDDSETSRITIDRLWGVFDAAVWTVKQVGWARDLLAGDKLKELQAIFDQEAKKYDVPWAARPWHRCWQDDLLSRPDGSGRGTF